MTTPCRLLAAACVLGVAVSACSDADESTTTSTVFAIDTPATVAATPPATAVPTVATIGPVTVATTDPPVTPTGPVTSDTADIPVVPLDTADTDTPTLIEVVVGDATGPDRIELVPLGSTVTLTVVNNDSADEFHLHGYDLGDGQEFAAGDTASFTFTADVAGDFELESHESDHVLLVLHVQ